MRLTIAAAVLAETLPLVLSSSTKQDFSHVISVGSPESSSNGKLREFLAERQTLANVNIKHPTGEKLRSIHRRQLLNVGGAGLKECDPTDKGADVGILSCGSGRICMESVESALGGYCTMEEMSRHLQGNSTLISDLNDICYGPDAYATCTCEGVDVEAYTGSISCSYVPSCRDAPNTCGDNVTFCYTQTYDLTIMDQYSGSAKSCYFFYEPKQMSYCFSLTIPSDGTPEFCEIEVDGTKCNSCASVDQYYDGAYSSCTEFDCSNTNVGTSSTYCNYNIPSKQVQNILLFDSLPCENGCNLCGEGQRITGVDVDFSLLNNQTYDCGKIELAALAGYFEGSNLCTDLSPAIEEICGCSGSGSGLDPTEAPVDPFECDICGEGLNMTNPTATLEVPSLGSVSCAQLAEPGLLASTECPVVQSLVREPCGCVSDQTIITETSTAAPNSTLPPLEPAPGPGVVAVNAQSGSSTLAYAGAVSMIGMTFVAVVTSLFVFA